MTPFELWQKVEGEKELSIFRSKLKPEDFHRLRSIVQALCIRWGLREIENFSNELIKKEVIKDDQ